MEKVISFLDSIEFIDTKPLGDLLMEAKIRVCEISSLPTPDRRIIDQTAGKQIAETLPGAPIVGCFDSNKEDFKGHEREIVCDEDGFKVIDLSRPYGFVSPVEPVYFETIMGEDGVERKYLTCVGYLWTKQYPDEVKHIMGNPMSMEIDGDVTQDEDSNCIFRNVNLNALCILGQDVLPCFKLAGFYNKESQFSLNKSTEEQDFILQRIFEIGRRYDVENGKLIELTHLTENCGNKQFSENGIGDGGATAEAIITSGVTESNDAYTISSIAVTGETAQTSADTAEAAVENVVNVVTTESKQNADLANNESAENTTTVVENNTKTVAAKVETTLENNSQKINTELESAIVQNNQELKDKVAEEKLSTNDDKLVSLQQTIDAQNAKIASLEQDISNYKEKLSLLDSQEKDRIVDSYKELLSDDDMKTIKESKNDLTSEEVESKLAMILANKMKSSVKKTGAVQVDINHIDENLEQDNSALPEFLQEALNIDREKGFSFNFIR